MKDLVPNVPQDSSPVASHSSTSSNSIEQRINICEMITKDAEEDARNFDGKPFTGRTVAEYFSNHGASIAALANLVKSLLEEKLNP